MGLQQLQNGRWRVQVRRRGFATFDKVFESEAEAQAALALRERMTQKAKAADTTLRELWELYRESADFERLAENSKTAYTQRIQPALEALGDYALAVLDDNTEIVRRHFDKRSKTGKANETLRLEIASMSAVLRWGVERELLHFNFMSKVKRPPPQQRSRRVHAVEKAGLQIAALQSDATAQHAKFNMLLSYLGCRPGELSTLRKENINFATNEMRFEKTKNGEDRQIHMNEQAKTLVRAQLAFSLPDSPYLFNSRRRDGTPAPYRYNNGLRTMKRNKAVDETYHPQAMRREFISRAIESNVELTVLKKQTGHKTTQALDIYNRGLSTAPEIRAVFDKLGEQQKLEMMLELTKLLGASAENLKKLFGDDLPAGAIPEDPFEEKKRRLRSR